MKNYILDSNFQEKISSMYKKLVNIIIKLKGDGNLGDNLNKKYEDITRNIMIKHNLTIILDKMYKCPRCQSELKSTSRNCYCPNCNFKFKISTKKIICQDNINECEN